MDYREVWDLQSHLVAARKERVIDRDLVLFVEHPPVFTLGSHCGLNNLTVPQGYLKKSGISVIRVERGGDITFHGPGQLVVYPIIDLRAARLPVTGHIEMLEEAMIQTAEAWGVQAERNRRNRGVWVGANKLGSVGIAVRHGICFHGMAFNVNVSLEPFGWMNPCGLKGVGITSMERELSRKISMHRVRETMKRSIESAYGVELVMTSLAALPESVRHRPTRTGADGSAEGRQNNRANTHSSGGDAYAP
ncbi:MAG: lipoyl(octanoyl) transferase LipB [Thermodesulfobacteriota bacterium]|nr:lipoyl(octanoyl) transferase LipB [Thermodesulfobacteriota bacterium]